MKNELSRRDFIRVGTTTALASGIAVGSDRGENAETSAQKDEAEVPDTLDLADRAKSAVNALTGILDSERRYMIHQSVDLYANPAFMAHNDTEDLVCWEGNENWGKGAEALIKMRLLSGSRQNAELDEKTLEGMVSCVGPDN